MNLLEIVKRLEQMSADYGSFPEGALQSSVNRLAAELKRQARTAPAPLVARS